MGKRVVIEERAYRAVEIVVRMLVDERVSKHDLRDYVATEVAAGGGARRTDDPLFGGIKNVRTATQKWED